MKFVIFAFVCISAVFAQNVPAKGDIRNEFDHLLIETTLMNLNQLEHKLLQISREVNHLETTKTKNEQDLIIGELETMIAFTEGAQGVLKRELERKDLNILEQFNFEEALATSQILINNLKMVETKVKAIKTTA